MIARVVVLWTTALALFAMPALAQTQDPREVQAQKECMSGRADAGVALLAELYAVTGSEDYLYNQARCYEYARRPDEAINRFREYLRVAKNITPADRVDVDSHMQECRIMQARIEQERERRAKAEAAAAAQPMVPAAGVPPIPVAAPVLVPKAPASAWPSSPAYQPAPAYAAPAYAPAPLSAAPQPTAGLNLNAPPKAAESTPIYETWWFWTGVVAVVGGGVTAILLGTRHSTGNACARSSIPCDAVK